MRRLYGGTIVVLGLAFILIVVGIVCGDPVGVLNKARYICLECIGIG